LQERERIGRIFKEHASAAQGRPRGMRLASSV
jgi:hypothetical protein